MHQPSVVSIGKRGFVRVIETHDRIVGRTYRTAERACQERIADEKAAVRRALRSFIELGSALIGARDAQTPLDAAVADGPGWEGLGALVATASVLAETIASDPLEHVLAGYARFRRYTPRMLRTLSTGSNAPTRAPPARALRRHETPSRGGPPQAPRDAAPAPRSALSAPRRPRAQRPRHHRSGAETTKHVGRPWTFVQYRKGNPLDMAHPAKARIWLRQGKAHLARARPAVVELRCPCAVACFIRKRRESDEQQRMK